MSKRMTVTLSGVVGAGKSTTAQAIVQALRAGGLSAEHIRFQEFTQLRVASREPRGRDATPAPASSPGSGRQETRWTGYRRRRLSVGVAAGYAMRVLVYRWRLARIPPGTVAVFDRYFYDSLAHYDLEAAGWPLKVLLKAIPRPTVATLLLAEETTILRRRAHYSREYAHEVARSYEQLPLYLPNLQVARTDAFDALGPVVARAVAVVKASFSQGTS